MNRGLQFGWIFGAALIAYGIFYRLADIHYSSALGWVFYLLLPIAVFLALRATRGDRDGKLSFGYATRVGSVAIALSSALYCVYVFIHNRFFDDSLLQTLLTDQQAAFSERGLSGAELDQALQYVRILTQPFAFSVVVFIQLFLFGLMSTVILAAFLRRKEPPIATAAQ